MLDAQDCAERSATVRRVTRDDEDESVADLMVSTAAGRGARGGLDRARRLREGAHDTESPRRVSGVHSETGVGTEDGEADEVRR